MEWNHCVQSLGSESIVEARDVGVFRGFPWADEIELHTAPNVNRTWVSPMDDNTPESGYAAPRLDRGTDEILIIL